METMIQEEKQKLILNHELEMMRMEHERHYKMKKMELDQQQKHKERQHKLDMMGWLGKLFGCN